MLDRYPVSTSAGDYWSHVPVEELIEELDKDILTCDSCDEQIAGEAYFCDGSNYYCEACAQEMTNKALEEASEFAVRECKITQPIPPYYPEREHRCTPDEYKDGLRGSYTPTAYECHCRHRCTNYDQLIADQKLKRNDAHDNVYYAVIRHRIEELLDEQEDFMREEYDDLNEGDAPDGDDDGP